MKLFLFFALLIAAMQICRTEGDRKIYHCQGTYPAITCPHILAHECLAFCSSKAPTTRQTGLIEVGSVVCEGTNPKMYCNSNSASYCQTFCASAKKTQLLPGLKYGERVTVHGVFNGPQMAPSSEFDIASYLQKFAVC